MEILKYYVKLYPRVWVERFLIKGKINLCKAEFILAICM